jgi:hypothetical protein
MTRVGLLSHRKKNNNIKNILDAALKFCCVHKLCISLCRSAFNELENSGLSVVTTAETQGHVGGSGSGGGGGCSGLFLF